MDLREEADERDPPAWAVEPIAWASCLANAALPTAVLDAALRAFKSPMSTSAAFVLYVCAFTALVCALKPWSAPI